MNDVDRLAASHPILTPDPKAGPRLDSRLSIGVFARRSLLSMKALRLYDRLGLLSPAEVDPGNGYHQYRESQLDTARFIARLRQLDMPLAQVADVIAAPASERGELLAAYWNTMERRIAGQRELMAHLQLTLAGQEGNYDMFEIQERDIPEQLVLTEQRHITVSELSRWLGETIGRQWTTAEALGGVTGPIFVIYHGAVNEDSDGPVEVCAPINPTQDHIPNVPTRIEPAHREAYTRIRKAQVEFPQILSAYDAVEQWMPKHGKACSAAPREVYFTDFMNAGPNDEVCDIAFPIEQA